MSIDANFNAYLNLKPPGTEGQPYVIPGMPSPNETGGAEAATANLALHLGYSQKDTIGSALDDVLALAQQLNIALVLPYGSLEAIQNYLNTLDPTLPSLPPVRAFLLLAEQSLKQGKIAGFQLAAKEGVADDKAQAEAYREMVENDQSNTTVNKKQTRGAIPSTADTSSSKEGEDDGAEKVAPIKDGTSTAEPKLRKTSYEGFEKNEGYGFGAMQDNLDGNLNTATNIASDISSQIAAGRANATDELDTKPEISLGRTDKTENANLWLSGNVYVTFLIEYMALQRVLMQNKIVQGGVELAGMNLVVELAKTTADIIMNIAHLNQMIHIVTAVMSGVAIGVSCFGLGLGMFDKSKLEMGTVIGQMGSSLERLATSATQAATDIPIAIQEGLKEIMQAYRQIAQHQMDKSQEATRASEEQIQQLLASLDKIRDGLQQAIASALR